MRTSLTGDPLFTPSTRAVQAPDYALLATCRVVAGNPTLTGRPARPEPPAPTPVRRSSRWRSGRLYHSARLG